MDRNYLTPTALNRYLKAKLENDVHLNRIYITGELSNVKYHYSGHCYFTLKDEHSRINAVMFQSQLKKVLFKLEDGMKVLATCRLSVYEAQGAYQLYVDKLDIDGLGNLYMAYEKRRLLLEKEGLFSQSHKKAIPSYATDIAIITASSGAAIHDIMRTIHMRSPSTKMTLYPSLVQGEQASSMLVRRLKEADQNHHDVIIIGRGGGSIEDLWPFNDETLARTIYHATTPIISGVGHESDVTICDFVADARAATPTAAATLASFKQEDLLALLEMYQNRMTQLLNQQIKIKQQHLNQLTSTGIFKHPERLYEQAIQRNDELSYRLINSMTSKYHQKYHQLTLLNQKIMNQSTLLTNHQKQSMNFYTQRLNTLMVQQLKSNQKQLVSQIQQLNAYNPLNVVQRGFTLTMQNEKVITKKSDINYKEPLTIRFMDGDVQTYPKEDSHEENDI